MGRPIVVTKRQPSPTPEFDGWCIVPENWSRLEISDDGENWITINGALSVTDGFEIDLETV